MEITIHLFTLDFKSMKQTLPDLGAKFTGRQSLFFACTFLIILCLPINIHLLGLSSDPTFIENRKPRDFPSISERAVFLKEYRENLKTYIRDNFGFRVELLKLNILANYYIGVSAIPTLLSGKEGRLFLKKDWNALDQYRGIDRFSDIELDRWIDIMESYQKWLDNQKIDFIILIAPNQESIYSEFMPDYAYKVNSDLRIKQVLRRVHERHSSLNIIYPRSDLMNAKKEYPSNFLYHQLENHWNELGSFVSYQTLMRDIQKRFSSVVPLAVSDIDIKSIPIQWDIPPLSEIESRVNLVGNSKVRFIESLKDDANPGRMLKTYSDVTTPLGILVYGDSFADVGLLNYLRESFQFVISVETNWSQFPTFLIENQKPNIVIFEMVERYLARGLSYDPRIEFQTKATSAPSLALLMSRFKNMGAGYVDNVKLDSKNGIILATGWAYQVNNKKTINKIYVYLGSKLIGISSPDHKRADITGSEPILSGFNIPIIIDSTASCADKVKIIAEDYNLTTYEILMSPQNRIEIQKAINKLVKKCNVKVK